MRPPFVRMKLIPLAQSIALPPPRPTIRSIPPLRRGGFHTGVHVGRCGVLLHVVEHEDVAPRPAQQSQRPVRDARADDPRIGHEQNSLSAQSVRQDRELRQRAIPEYYTRRGMNIERFHRSVGFYALRAY